MKYKYEGQSGPLVQCSNSSLSHVGVHSNSNERMEVSEILYWSIVHNSFVMTDYPEGKNMYVIKDTNNSLGISNSTSKEYFKYKDILN